MDGRDGPKNPLATCQHGRKRPNIPPMTCETLPVRVEVLALHPFSGSGVLALADVELTVGGIALILHGVQLRADAHKTEVTLPRYRDASGAWKAAVTLPEELRGPVGDVVIAAALEAGLLREASSR